MTVTYTQIPFDILFSSILDFHSTEFLYLRQILRHMSQFYIHKSKDIAMAVFTQTWIKSESMEKRAKQKYDLASS